MFSSNDTLTTDDILVARLRKGQQDAATSLYRRYANQLYRLATAQLGDELSVRVSPEDIVQSVFRTFFRRVNSGQYNLPEGEQLWRLLLVMALNKIRANGTHHRAAKRSISSTTSICDVAMEIDEVHDNPEDLQILKLTIDELLETYPEAQRAIIVMRINGFDIGEIASRSGRSNRTIERTLQRFRKQLSKLLAPAI